MSQEARSVDQDVPEEQQEQEEQQQDQQKNSGDDVVEETNGMTFQKRIIPKQRTQSVQSVLSSVSLKSFVQQKPFVPPPHSQSQFIHTKAHIQAPAAAASSKRRASFEIGQRLPFKKEGPDVDNNTATQSTVEAESDGEVEDTEQDKQLTDEALKKLSSLSRFQPAEVDMRMDNKAQDHIGEAKPVEPISLISRNSSQIQLNLQPQAKRVLSQARIMQQQNSPVVPQIQEDMQENQTNSQTVHSQLLSQTTSSQDLRSFQPSPSSQHDNTNLKTINDPKRPMYIPAVLRQSNTNLKPEDVKHINEQNSRRSKNVIADAAHSLRSQTSHWRMSFENPNRLPTRAHWRRDLTRQSCAYCDKQFTFFERRHHCRRCGDIFCAEHTSHLLKLGADAQFTIGGSGILCKVCDNCIKDYEGFVKSKFGEAAITKKASVMKMDNRQQGNNNLENSAVVGSVPADWSWSSF
jgi:hypothetical protein